jgi:hypothetical protein
MAKRAIFTLDAANKIAKAVNQVLGSSDNTGDLSGRNQAYTRIFWAALTQTTDDDGKPITTFVEQYVTTPDMGEDVAYNDRPGGRTGTVANGPIYLDYALLEQEFDNTTTPRTPVPIYQAIDQNNIVIVSVIDDPSSADPSGEYRQSAVDSGSATGMPPESMTVPTPTVYFENAAEAGFNNHTGADAGWEKSHWIPNEEAFTNAYPAQQVGQTTDDTPIPIFSGCVPNPRALFAVNVVAEYTYCGLGASNYSYHVLDLSGHKLGTAMLPVVQAVYKFSNPDMGLGFLRSGW